MKTFRRDVLTAGTTAAMMAIADSGRAMDALAQPVGAKKGFDVVIVGGGSAGAVLAVRLSADAQRRVLLLEAGPNLAPGAYPKVLTDANIVAAAAFDGHYHTNDDDDRLGHDIPVPRGRVIGGSSAVAGTAAMRARPADFARWTKRGIEGWSWEEVLAASRQWRTRRPAMIFGMAAAGRSRSANGRWKKILPRCASSSRPRKCHQRCEFALEPPVRISVEGAHSPGSLEHAAVLRPIKAKPFGWPR
jgi:hypothetical protein